MCLTLYPTLITFYLWWLLKMLMAVVAKTCVAFLLSTNCASLAEGPKQLAQKLVPLSCRYDSRSAFGCNCE